MTLDRYLVDGEFCIEYGSSPFTIFEEVRTVLVDRMLKNRGYWSDFGEKLKEKCPTLEHD